MVKPLIAIDTRACRKTSKTQTHKAIVSWRHVVKQLVEEEERLLPIEFERENDAK